MGEDKQLKMKLKKNRIEIFLVLVLFLSAFWLWTLPIQQNPMPFGEGDAAWMFGVGDYISQEDKTITKLPEYIHLWYYHFFKDKPAQLHYPPPYHIDYAIMQFLTDERIVSVYLFVAITCFLGVFSAYFLIRKLYGLAPGFMVGFAMIFSIRDIFTYLWGQRPTLSAFVYIPIIMYCYYAYLNPLKDKPKPVYLYIMMFLIATQFYFHIMGSVVTISVLVVYTIFWSIKEKKLPFDMPGLKHIIASMLLLVILIAPFLYIYAAGVTVSSDNGFKPDRLFSWFKLPENTGGYPAEWFRYSGLYSWFLIPFLFLGIILLLFRRKQRDLLLLSWLVGLFAALHLDVIGLAEFSKVARMLLGESPLFYSIIVVGVIGLADLVKLPDGSKKFVNYGLAFLFIIVVVLTTGKQAYGLLDDAYSGAARITPAQYELTVWINENLPEDALLYDIGTLTYPKKRFIHVLSHRALINDIEGEREAKAQLGLLDFKPSHIIIDYSDLTATGQNDQIMQINEWEKTNLANATPIYDKDNIKVYKIENQ